MTRSLAEALASADAARKRHVRYHWCRLRNDFPYLPLWRAVSRRAQVPVHQVISVALCLECLANKSEPRGSVASLSVAEVAAALDLRPDVVARVRSVLEEPDISWIDQDFIVDFHERNPDREDPTAAQRQRIFRAKRKAERERLFGAQQTGPPVVHSNVTSRNESVTVTPRAEQSVTQQEVSRAARGERVEAPVWLIDKRSGESAENISESGQAEVWLESEGVRIIVERMLCTAPLAKVRIDRWRRDLSDDSVAAVAAIVAADRTDLVGARFHNLIVDTIKRQRIEARGQQLPLLPPRPKKLAG